MSDKQIEHELRFLAVAAEQAGEGIVVVDLNGIICFVNPAWAIMHGYDGTDKLVGEHISMFHTEEEMKRKRE